MSQLHHKKEIEFSVAKTLSLFALLLCVSMIGTSFISIDSKSNNNVSIAPHAAQGYFVQEEIPGKFKMIKAVFGKEEIILREDRIQLLMKKSKFEESSYFLFDGSNKNVQIIGMNPIETTVQPIANKAMADVLKATSMTVTKFEKVKYSNLYNDMDLIFSISGNGVNAEIIAKENVNVASKFKMSVFANSNVVNRSGDIAFQHPESASNVTVKSGKKKLNFNSNKIQFSESDEEAPGNLNFDIILN